MGIVRSLEGEIAYCEGLVQDMTKRKYREQAMQQTVHWRRCSVPVLLS